MTRICKCKIQLFHYFVAVLFRKYYLVQADKYKTALEPNKSRKQVPAQNEIIIQC